MDQTQFPPNMVDHNPEQASARAHYFQLRDKLVSLNSAPMRDTASIETVVKDLEKAQLAYKATHGLFGNNPIDDQTSEIIGNAFHKF